MTTPETTTKIRRPRLTAKTIEDLRAMLNEANGSNLANRMSDDRESQHTAKQVDRGINWLQRLIEAAESRKPSP
jgi:hypothetical protein